MNLQNLKRFLGLVIVIGFFDLPIGYYTFLRITVFIACIILVYDSTKSRSQGWIFTYAIIGILFNPIIPIHLGKTLWIFVDLFTIGALIWSFDNGPNPYFKLISMYHELVSASKEDTEPTLFLTIHPLTVSCSDCNMKLKLRDSHAKSPEESVHGLEDTLQCETCLKFQVSKTDSEMPCPCGGISKKHIEKVCPKCESANVITKKNVTKRYM